MATIRPKIKIGTLQPTGFMIVDVSSADVDFDALSKRVCRIVVGTAGDIAVVLSDMSPGGVDAPVTMTSAQVTALGGVIDGHFKAILNSGTTAAEIGAFYF